MAGVALVALVLAAYVLAAIRQRRSGSAWSVGRTASFIIGCGLLAVAISPWVMAVAHADLRGHMVQHLLLGMFAPLGLVLGAPGTLLLRTLPVLAARQVVSFLDTLPVRILIHPVTALVLDIGGMYVLYLTSLYVLSVSGAVADDRVLRYLVPSCTSWISQPG